MNPRFYKVLTERPACSTRSFLVLPSDLTLAFLEHFARRLEHLVLTFAKLSRIFAPNALELIDQFPHTIKLAQARLILPNWIIDGVQDSLAFLLQQSPATFLLPLQFVELCAGAGRRLLEGVQERTLTGASA